MKKFAIVVVFVLTLVASIALAADRRVVVSNRSDMTVTRLYGSNVNTNRWEEDILGSDVLPPGRSVIVDFDDGTGACLFDIKVVFSDGHSVRRDDVNVCSESNLVIY